MEILSEHRTLVNYILTDSFQHSNSIWSNILLGKEIIFRHSGGLPAPNYEASGISSYTCQGFRSP